MNSNGCSDYYLTQRAESLPGDLRARDDDRDLFLFKYKSQEAVA